MTKRKVKAPNLRPRASEVGAQSSPAMKEAFRNRKHPSADHCPRFAPSNSGISFGKPELSYYTMWSTAHLLSAPALHSDKGLNQALPRDTTSSMLRIPWKRRFAPKAPQLHRGHAVVTTVLSLPTLPNSRGTLDFVVVRDFARSSGTCIWSKVPNPPLPKKAPCSIWKGDS